MKLIQLNIWCGKLQYQIPDFLNHESADIVCMQEVNDLKGPSGALFVTLDELQEKTHYSERHMSPAYSSQYMQRSTLFGNAILTNFQIKNSSTVFTNGQYKDNFDLTVDDFNVRNFQHLVLDCNGQSLHIINYHGYLVLESKLGNDKTTAHVQMIADYIQGLTGPVILTGDFNLSPASPSMQPLNKLLTSLSAGLTSTYTQFSNHLEVCDYIFVNEYVKVTSFAASEALVSDHKALILEFEV